MMSQASRDDGPGGKDATGRDATSRDVSDQDASGSAVERIIAVVAPVEAAGQRLDRWLADAAGDVSRSRLKALIEAGQVTLDGVAVTQARHALKGGEQVRVALPPPEDATPAAQPIPLVVVHEDADLIVIDKPAGLVVHPAAGHADGTLVNALIAHCGESLSGIGGVRRPGIVHRLDKDTSGLLVVAKNDAAHQGLSAQFADHGRTGALERAYLALVWGAPRRTRGTIRTFIDRSPRNREKMAVMPEGRGKEAITHYDVLEAFPAGASEPIVSLVRCVLETGRTHQIRVHMAHLGHPLLGDAVYGAGFATRAARLSPEAREALVALDRQALHAALLGFEHPRTGEMLVFESDPPADFARMQDTLAGL
jgi:23S rRNA pseudouridine1911/1915/1917 synthase